MEIIEMKRVKMSELRTDNSNPNEMDDSTRARLKKSIDKFGYLQPIVVDKKTMIIADGQHRYEEIIQMGVNEVDVVLADFADDAERRAFRQAANKIRGSHIPERDTVDFKKIMEAGRGDLLEIATGMRIGQVEQHMRRYGDDLLETKDTAPENLDDIETSIERGEVYTLGNHRLICGDATKQEDVNTLMDDHKARLILTDPPWNVNYGSAKGPKFKQRSIENDNLKGEFPEFLEQSFNKMTGVAEQGCMTYVFMSAQEWGTIMPMMEKNNFHWSSTIMETGQ